MNFIRDDIRRLYLRFLVPSLTGAVVISIYSFVDAIAVGQAEGTLGAAAMAVINPVYGVMVFLAVLLGIGGSICMSVAKGQGNEEKGNACFTDAVLLTVLLTALIWSFLWFFREPVYAFFGADETVMAKTCEYGDIVILGLPLFVGTIFLGNFIRNDGAPRFVMAAVTVGGCVNMFGDWFLVFPMGMGMRGAALATVTGTFVQGVILIAHFFRPSCGLRLVRPNHIFRGFRRILITGVGAGILDLGAVVLGTLMNRQIMAYGGTVELAVYGVLSTIMALFQALFGGVGQAVQPLASANCGARQAERLRTLWRMGFATAVALGVLFTATGEFFPIPLTKLFVDASPEMLTAAPGIFRLYFLVYLFLGICVVGTYYLQSVLEERLSLAFGVAHSALLSGLFILVLPCFLGITGVWLAIPLADLVIAVAVAVSVHRINAGLEKKLGLV